VKEISVLGIDLAKNIFQLCGVDKFGRQILTKKVRRAEFVKYVANLKAELIVMEACGGANHWAREFQKLGFKVKLIAPQFVKPFVKTNKNDYADAQAIVEAAVRPHMRFVPIKAIWQQDIQCVHRVRERLVKEKTMLSNEIRGLLAEYGITMAQGFSALKRVLGSLYQIPEPRITEEIKILVQTLYEELIGVEEKIKVLDKKLSVIFSENETCRRISKVRGIGPIIGTAVLCTIVDPHIFKNGRGAAASIGLVPKHVSTGGKTRLLGISKRGDGYLRRLMVQGAKAALRTAHKHGDGLSIWALKKQTERGPNKAAVALANKNMRIIWALMSKNEEYRPRLAV
jgi:transposase